ncbi:MAG: SDR family oxidoreductase [Bacteroidales bacterium]|nr:SDR family oxidoreductase [Bacteroidales bacterium]MCF8456825.1 SDR family oxidoreductase [Bacteroidales bacterium]
MTILVVGASGATGIRLVEELLNRDQYVRVIVRSPENFPDKIKNNERLSMIAASVLQLSDEEMKQHVAGCDAIASCLGHNLNFKGVYGKPRRLVTEATRRLCKAIKATNPETSIKFVLMNTVANRNRDINETIPFAQKCLIALLRLLLPPHPDNEQAAEYLRTDIGKNDNAIEWVAVRPSGLIDEESPSEIEVYPSPMRSILNDGQISRINVGHFMADLITNTDLWNEWKGQMPVIYNKGTALPQSGS